MNPGLPDDHASIEFYDGDYPSPDGPYPENFDGVTEFQGIAGDVPRYCRLAEASGGPILEVFCGTGRVLLPLARDGHTVWGADISAGLLDRCRAKLERESEDTRSRVRLFVQDASRLALEYRAFHLAVMAFNSLLCIPDFDGQLAALGAVGRHLVPGGTLLLDIVNPLRLKIDGDPVPKPFFTRRHPATGHLYTRFATMGAFDEQHRQKLEGWYDEILPDGLIRRRLYSLLWRPIFRHEIELMLDKAGFLVRSIEGGHGGETYKASSPRMFIAAERRE